MIYGNKFLPKKEESISVQEFGVESIVYNEYVNYKGLLESCTDDNSRSILEAQVQVLYEISFKDIWERIKKMWRDLIQWFKDLWNKIFNKEEKIKKQEDEIQKRVDEAVKEALRKNNGNVTTNRDVTSYYNGKVQDVSVNIFEYEIPTSWDIRLELVDYTTVKTEKHTNGKGEKKEIKCSVGNLQGKDIPSFFEIGVFDKIVTSKMESKNLEEELKSLYYPYIDKSEISFEDKKVENSDKMHSNLEKAIKEIESARDRLRDDASYIGKYIKQINDIINKYDKLIDFMSSKPLANGLTASIKFGSNSINDEDKYDDGFPKKLNYYKEIRDIIMATLNCYKNILGITTKAREKLIKYQYTFIRILDESVDKALKATYDGSR